MRLFKLVGVGIKHTYFEDKRTAKVARLVMNGITVNEDGEEVENLRAGFRVGRGPDHWKGESHV